MNKHEELDIAILSALLKCKCFKLDRTILSILLSPRNALRWGYSNAAVVPCVRQSVRLSVRGPCEHDRDYTIACFFVKLGRHVNHDKRMNPTVNLDIFASIYFCEFKQKAYRFIFVLLIFANSFKC